MKLDLKTVLPYVVLIASIGVSWGMWSERLNAVENKADSVSEMQKDIAVIKEQISDLQEDIQEIKELLRD
jgi:peptidoglycan hydrolase CwlO-like protein